MGLFKQKDVIPNYIHADLIPKPKTKPKVLITAQSTLANGRIMLSVADDTVQATKKSLHYSGFARYDVYSHGISAFFGLYEFIKNVHSLYETYKDKTATQRKTKLSIKTLACIISGGLAGLGMTWLIQGFGVTVAGIASFPIILPVVGLTLSTLSLIKASWDLHHSQKKEKTTKADYETYLAKETPATKKIIEQLDAEIAAVKVKGKNVNQEKLSEYQAEIKFIKDWSPDPVKKHYALKDAYEQTRADRLETERVIAFASIGIVLSSAALSITVLGIALGAATMGIAPAVIAWTSLSIYLGIKLFRYIDNKMDHHLSNGMRNFFQHAWQRLSGHRPAPEPSQPSLLILPAKPFTPHKIHKQLLQLPPVDTHLFKHIPKESPPLPPFGTPTRPHIQAEAYENGQVRKSRSMEFFHKPYTESHKKHHAFPRTRVSHTP